MCAHVCVCVIERVDTDKHTFEHIKCNRITSFFPTVRFLWVLILFFTTAENQFRESPFFSFFSENVVACMFVFVS